MAHLERNLLPTWPILRPSWAHLRPNFAKNLHQIAPEISRSAPRDSKTTQEVRSPEGSRTAPGTRIFMVWGSISDLIFQFFLQSLLQFFMASRPQIQGTWRLGARSALDNSILSTFWWGVDVMAKSWKPHHVTIIARVGNSSKMKLRKNIENDLK